MRGPWGLIFTCFIFIWGNYFHDKQIDSLSRSSSNIWEFLMGKHKSIQFLYVLLMLFIYPDFISEFNDESVNRNWQGIDLFIMKIIAPNKNKTCKYQPSWTSHLLGSNPKRGNVQLIRRETPMTEFIVYYR
jgi:hypothetical protein